MDRRATEQTHRGEADGGGGNPVVTSAKVRHRTTTNVSGRICVLRSVLLSLLVAASGCEALDTSGPQPRKRSPDRDGQCREEARPHAYFYAAENRTNYAPDDPFDDGCKMLVPDHLFCCPAVPSPGPSR